MSGLALQHHVTIEREGKPVAAFAERVVIGPNRITKLEVWDSRTPLIQEPQLTTLARRLDEVRPTLPDGLPVDRVVIYPDKISISDDLQARIAKRCPPGADFNTWLLGVVQAAGIKAEPIDGEEGGTK